MTMGEDGWKTSPDELDGVVTLNGEEASTVVSSTQKSEQTIREETHEAEDLIRRELEGRPQTIPELLDLPSSQALSPQVLLYAITNLLAEDDIVQEGRRLQIP